MLVRALSFAVIGVDAVPVEVETDITKGLPSYTIVGLPSGAVKESDDRIRAAIRNSGFPFPGRKVTVNLAPADLRKDGSLLDLSIALSILCAEGVLAGESLTNWLIAGELSLDGYVRPIRGALSQALLARDLGISGIITPASNFEEAGLVPEIRVAAVQTLKEAADILSGAATPSIGEANTDSERPFSGRCGLAPRRGQSFGDGLPPDLSDVSGQPMARRALEIAAAGNHALLMVGPPGCGKTMLAERMSGILPPFPRLEALETTRIYSAAAEPPWPKPLLYRPFRSPHSSITAAGLLGGGNPPQPGEISFAHGGVLFLDEFSEFRPDVREALRQPLESGEILISRAGRRYRFPCRFLLLAASNPCPCGNLGHPRSICRCSPRVLERFARKFSGPLLDRIDLSVSVPPPESQVWSDRTGEASATVRKRVEACRLIQEARYAERANRSNGSAG
ncbi:MAG: YifB family Mg chelatase-like AAA ATPase, partial [Syntrophorhabdaceae bacterium]|nr:YifB family Mg chelatase-like AAA ATPase [Syntrophorhabdaceae bacterium]